MKKIILLIALLLCPIFVDAKVGTTIKCDKSEVVAKETFTCTISVMPDETSPITSFKAAIDYPTDLKLTKIIPASGWTSNSSSLIDLTNPSYGEGQGLTTTLNIASLVFSVNSNVTYGNKSIVLKSYDVLEEETHNFKILSSNNYLSTLTVSGIDFLFNRNTTTYNLETTKDSVSINATVMDTNSNFKEGYGPRSVNLNYGKNTIQIIVVAQNNATNTYTLNIERLDQRSNNNNLKELKVSEGTMSPSFNKNTLTYNVSVPHDVKSIAIEATKEVSSSTYVNGFGPRTIDLVDGLTTAQIKVKSETGIEKAYTLNITKNEKSSNNYLKAVKLSNATINFDKNVYEYNVNVLYNVLEMEIIAVPEDIKSKVEVVGNKALVLGENIFTVNVIAENGSVLSYKFIINRLEEGRVLSSNNYLSELLISEYPIDFNKDLTNYNIKIEDESRLTISYNQEDPNATVLIEGNNALKNGSKILIKVTSEDNTVRTYTINIEKEEFDPYYIYAGLGLVVVLLLLVFLFRKKIFKKKDEQIISEEIPLTTSKLVLGSKKTDTTKDIKEEQVVIPSEDEMKK